jgi:uncharacterized membrane protein YdjX (TVP38/TMEM64 family)
VSPSKKANKNKPETNSRSAQRKTRAVRSVRVAAQQSTPPTTPVTAQKPAQITATATAEISQPAATWRTNALRGLALLFVIGISYFIFSIRDRIEEFEQYGYVGIFLVAMLANATVLLPAPGVAIIYAMGSVFNPLWVGLVAGTGGALGELSGYLAGFSGQAVIERGDIYNRIHPWVEKYGGWAVLVLSAIPNPFFDIAGVAAGMVKMPVRTFLISTWIGQIIKMTAFAYAGQASLQAVEQFIK